MLTDCPKCWDTPCTCGHEYEQEYWTVERLKALIFVLLGVLKKKKRQSDAQRDNKN
jgi:hypothetical protein